MLYVSPGLPGLLLCGTFRDFREQLRPIKTDLADVFVIKGLLGINILSCARIKLAPV